MYIEKEYLFKKINEYCEVKNIDLSFDEKYKLSTEVSRRLDETRVLTTEEFIELLEHNEELDTCKNIYFNDEIIEIEEIGEEETIDFNVSGDHLFYANGILTHNSAVNSTEADNSNVSDSLGSVQTADFLLFLLQTPEMKENKEIVFKITKNRYTGRTDTWIMNIDYTHMRFSDVITENSIEHQKILNELVDTSNNSKLNDAMDFSLDSLNIITAEKIKKADEFAINEIKEINKVDMEIVMKDNKSKDPLKDESEELFKQLGIL